MQPTWLAQHASKHDSRSFYDSVAGIEAVYTYNIHSACFV